MQIGRQTDCSFEIHSLCISFEIKLFCTSFLLFIQLSCKQKKALRRRENIFSLKKALLILKAKIPWNVVCVILVNRHTTVV